MTAAKILILEDDPDVARVYEAALKEDGNAVTVCRTFEQAREHLRHEQPDAVVTDVRVGEYNGLQLALLFRRASPDGRVVVVTGFDDAVLRRDVGAMQGEFLLKPVRVAQLKNAVYA
jgi:DNA-binding NtrC family response regulator